MKVTGFTFIRNAIKFDYPVKEAIESILPVCDEFVVALGNSDDDTLSLIKSINSDKIRILPTVWDDSLREKGSVLAVETNKAYDEIAHDSDWCFYIQGDEVVHEKYLDVIRQGMLKWKDDKTVEGLLFKYKHFFGTYDYVADSRSWYRREIRIVRRNSKIRSYRDAQGFRNLDNTKLNVKLLDAYVYHYGWVKDPFHQQRKQESFNKLWHDDEWVKKHVGRQEHFDYSCFDSLDTFKETHPLVMEKRIQSKNWKFEFDPSIKKLSFKNKVLMQVEKMTGWRVGEYRNYRIL